MLQTPDGSRARIRLAEAYRALEEIDRDRRAERDPSLGKAMEQRIIQRELLELELQDLDDQMDRIREVSSQFPDLR